MPYRRLPNTDVARLRAMKIVYLKGKELPPFKLAFSQSSFSKVQSFLHSYEHALLIHKNAFANQVNKSRDYANTLKKAKLYISHFIQVLNMGIIRGEIPASARTYFGLEENDSRVPTLNTEAEVIKWGEVIVKGEADRIRKGMAPVTNPTMAVVKVRYENFLEAYNNQKTLQKTNSRTLVDLSKLRKDADEIIAKIWNEVEATYAELPEEQKRERAKEYGLVYVFRKNELRNMHVLKNETISNSTV
jgi:hypothetical protein